MQFKDIKQFPHSAWRAQYDLDAVEETLKRWDRPDMGSPLILNPDFQRGHVWTADQQTAYIEYLLKGGTTGVNVYFNCSSWQEDYNTPVYCVDGLQRLTAIMAFINNRVPAYGHRYHEFTDSIRYCHASVTLHMLKVRSKRELLNVYLDFNSGGTPHNPSELQRVAQMILDTPVNATL